jgi:hypothetical protein
MNTRWVIIILGSVAILLFAAMGAVFAMVTANTSKLPPPPLVLPGGSNAISRPPYAGIHPEIQELQASVQQLQTPMVTAVPDPPLSFLHPSMSVLPTLQQQLQLLYQAIQRTQASGLPNEVSIVITEDMATEEITRAVKAIPPTETAAGNFTISEVTAYFRPDTIELHAVAQFGNLIIYPKIRFGVIIRQDIPVIQNLTVELGRLGLPGFANDFIMKTVEDQSAALVGSLRQNASFKTLWIENELMGTTITTRR